MAEGTYNLLHIEIRSEGLALKTWTCTLWLEFNDSLVWHLCGEQSITECSTFTWIDNKHSLDNNEDYNRVVHNSTDMINSMTNTTAICTTICWSDRLNQIQITPVHAKWLTSVSSVISMKSVHTSAKDMAKTVMISMRVSCSKSSSQSDVGASTRRSRIGSSRVHLNVSITPGWAHTQDLKTSRIWIGYHNRKCYCENTTQGFSWWTLYVSLWRTILAGGRAQPSIKKMHLFVTLRGGSEC